MADDGRISYSETAPLVGRTELIPVTDPVGNIPFEEIIIRLILLVDINYVTRRKLDLFSLHVDHMAEMRLFRTAAVVKHQRDGVTDLACTHFHDM